ncbi:hypothetical protein ALC56_04674, partial [Trachymyrmex septentrionalis]
RSKIESIRHKQNFLSFELEEFCIFIPREFARKPRSLHYNIHSLLHLCDDVHQYDVIENFSGFPFENYLGKLSNA